MIHPLRRLSILSSMLALAACGAADPSTTDEPAPSPEDSVLHGERDYASGMPTGQRMHKPYTFTVPPPPITVSEGDGGTAQ